MARASTVTGCSTRYGVLISICHLQVSQSVMTISGFAPLDAAEELGADLL